MTVLLAVLGAGVGLFIGGMLGFFAVYGLGVATGADTQQGALAMGAAMSGLPLGGMIGAVLGCVLVLRWRMKSGAKPAGRTENLIAVGLVLSVLAGLYGYFLYEPPKPYYPDSPARPVLQGEIRLPAGLADLDFIQGRRSMIRTYENTYYDADTVLAPRMDGDSVVLTTQQPLIFRRADRSVHLWVSPKLLLIFDLDLPDDPPARAVFTDWQQVSGMRPGFYEEDVPEDQMAQVHLRYKIKRGP